MAEMGIENLLMLNQGLTLLLYVIADNLDRSREHIAQRLAALREARCSITRERYVILRKGVELLSSLVEFG